MQRETLRQWSSALVAIAIVAIVGIVSVGPDAWGAEEKKQGKAPKTAPPAKSGQTMLSGGTVRVESTNASGAGIVANSKACVGDPPKIAKLKPDEGKAGDKVGITGKNFGTPGCPATVSFGPGTLASFTQANDGTMTATVPKEARQGIRLLIVTTESGEDSKPFLVK